MSMSLAIAVPAVLAGASSLPRGRLESLLRAAILVFLAGAVIAVALHLHLWALQAAGIQMTKPQGGDEIQTLINTLQANWMWLVVTGAGFLAVLVFGLYMFGWQRAPEAIIRFGGGVAGILVIAPAILK
jgi:hypothetical protein